ncbi:hypothetical protein [Streptomyces sp. NPDC048521]|uniref:hypothetical protein n=1 Tax=Streptomyces sp. NPDC048521 TaxID=3365566 RepID=UPI0037115A17
MAGLVEGAPWLLTCVSRPSAVRIGGELVGRQLLEQAGPFGELLVGALLHDPAFVEDHDPVGDGDVGDAVGNGSAGVRS